MLFDFLFLLKVVDAPLTFHKKIQIDVFFFNFICNYKIK